jgi:hypothetical protein
MENSSLSKSTVSFGIALAVASVVNALLVVAKEKSHDVQAAMQKMTGHHWLTHVAAVLVVFIGCGALPWMRRRGVTPGRLICAIVSSVAISGLIIVGFYLIGV